VPGNNNTHYFRHHSSSNSSQFSHQTGVFKEINANLCKTFPSLPYMETLFLY